MKQVIVEKQNVGEVYGNIRLILENARSSAYRAVNFTMVQAYWQIGQIIVEEEQKGEQRAEYGKNLIKELSVRLGKDYGKGFTISNLKYMRQFYLKFPKSHAPRDQLRPKVNALRVELTWTHYRLLLKIGRDDARSFYMNESVNSNWSTRELDRQINSLLFERIALSKDKKKVKELSIKGQLIRTPEDLVKDPYVLEFLGLKEDNKHLEKDLERVLIDRLKEFLLELGKGFSFVARQKRITLDGDHYYVDLVFYNYILKCFVLVDLKIGKLSHQDIGQMDFYTRYFEKEEKNEDDNPTVGLILCSEKNQTMVKYTLLEENENIFASKYKLYLPSEEELKKELTQERHFLEKKEVKNGRFNNENDKESV
jgi:predicted nuclease of restriction endonuclease-like (RecB) superfamily